MSLDKSVLSPVSISLFTCPFFPFPSFLPSFRLSLHPSVLLFDPVSVERLL